MDALFNRISEMNLTDVAVFAKEQAERLTKAIDKGKMPEQGSVWVAVLNKLSADIHRGNERSLVNGHRLVLAYLNWVDAAREEIAKAKARQAKRIPLVARRDISALDLFDVEIPKQYKPSDVLFRQGDTLRAVEFGPMQARIDLTNIGFEEEPQLPSSWFIKKVEER